MNASRLNKDSASKSDPWQVLDDGPHAGGWFGSCHPKPEPPAEHPAPSPAVIPRRRAQGAAKVGPKGREHAEDGEAAQRRAETGRARARRHAPGIEGAAPYVCQLCGDSSPPVGHWSDLSDWALLPAGGKGRWVPVCASCASSGGELGPAAQTGAPKL